ncbi:MAG: CRISPR-associated endonuclease Cas2 [Aquificota bacterium]|jgi:CRISPR-associated protein Cas2
MKVVVAYDISDDQRRNKVSQLLSSYGYRYQLSVFYIPNITRTELSRLVSRLRKLINKHQDRVRVYIVDKLEWVEGYIYEPWESFRVF